ncbi:uncharacterized protein PV09_08705 [Verruconis gallopava]|uniref:ML-like domain-containing protein n=1 Tax=Verruconis gallopava TaxID=253628 RepID=A0A0D1YFW4_9PEZI|nr:uncharacterized protein PV09_08705 [Verruconis gallopava]KIV99641.1 hypothetical protein PV09_08705 [Verruconis gallopava]
MDPGTTSSSTSTTSSTSPSPHAWSSFEERGDSVVEKVGLPTKKFAMASQSPLLARRRARRRHIDFDPTAQPQSTSTLCTTSPSSLWAMLTTLCLVLLAASSLPAAEAALVSFDNCLSPAVLSSKDLQFQPLFLDARYDDSNGTYTFNVTVYGNVTGTTDPSLPYPSPNNWNASDPHFNIIDAPDNYTTLFATVDVLSYTAWHPSPMRFCNQTIDGGCPWQPLFDVSPYSLDRLHAFSLSHDFDSAYSFASFATLLRVQSGAAANNNDYLACVQAGIAPSLGSSLSSALRCVPLAILILVGLATILAARFSPWSSPDAFHWTSNYGRDDDILRLVTPGFGDCLQYIQFVVLAGSLSLAYPGFYQPVVSRASWSVLMFNESFISKGEGYQSLRDGVYATNGTYGLTRLSQLAGMTKDEDVWAGMAVWLCIIIASVVILCQLAFAARTLFRLISDIPEEDLRSKNLPFTSGNVVRILFNYFLLPIISLSMFQLVVADRSPPYVVALAVVLIVAIILFAAWIFRLIFTTKPRVHLFDHLPLLLAYGPLYNTYSDEAAPYAFIPFLLTFVRGIAMGAVQPSGIAQLVILAICEVILILTLHAFRPFQSLTSMNAYHTFFSVVRLVTTLLMVAFAPSLGVSESTKGWVGYAVLLLHAAVLVFGFFLNAIQTLVEVFARLAGAGREARGGLTTVFGMRQLSKRVKRPGPRGSMGSQVTQLTETKSSMNRMSRAMSASSTMILNDGTPNNRASVGFENFSQAGESVTGNSPGTSTPAGGHSPFSFLPAGAAGAAQGRKASKVLEPSDPYFRPPRARRPTNELLAEDVSAGGEGRPRRSSQPLQHAMYSDLSEAPSVLGSERGSVGAAYFRAHHSDPGDLGDSRLRNTDYSTRESDFYYGVRGQALSSGPTRRLKTGPADPMGPVASATGWFRSIFGNKTKDKKKGFEVVRSTPLHLLQEQDEDPPVTDAQVPYSDKPEDVEQEKRESVIADLPESSSHAIDEEESRHDVVRPRPSQDTYVPQSESELLSPMRHASTREGPPRLAPISGVGSIHLPSRSASQVTTDSQRPPIPAVPRRSSKRNSRGETTFPKMQELARMASFRGPGNTDPEARVPFTSLSADPVEADNKERSRRTSAASSLYPASENDEQDMHDQERARSGTPRTGQVGRFQNNEFVYSHPYDGHFGTQPGPSYVPAGPPNDERRPMSTGRVVRHFAMEGVYSGELPHGSEAELVEEEERKNSMRR